MKEQFYREICIVQGVSTLHLLEHNWLFDKYQMTQLVHESTAHICLKLKQILFFEGFDRNRGSKNNHQGFLIIVTSVVKFESRVSRRIGDHYPVNG